VSAPVILVVLAAAFLVAALWRLRRDGKLAGAGRTWLLVAVLFAAIGSWLW
jgi:hypothetical protein